MRVKRTIKTKNKSKKIRNTWKTTMKRMKRTDGEDEK